MGWSSVDRLVFTSLYGSGPGAGHSIDDIVATGDYLDHSILAADEIRAAADRLVAAGLVDGDGAAFWHTRLAVSLCATAMAGHSDSSWAQRIPRVLDATVD